MKNNVEEERRLRVDAAHFWCSLDNHPNKPKWDNFKGDPAEYLYACAKFTRDQMITAGREDLAKIVESDYPKVFANTPDFGEEVENVREKDN